MSAPESAPLRVVAWSTGTIGRHAIAFGKYEQIFAKFDPSQVVLVQGEQDNEFVPGFGGTAPTPATNAWQGLDESFSVRGTDEARFDHVSGTSVLDGIPVWIEPRERAS